ncbi:MAG: helix-hairpin-helix domain-containing protein [Bacteroidota bacterium]
MIRVDVRTMGETYLKFPGLLNSIFPIRSALAKIVCLGGLIFSYGISYGQDYPRTEYNLEKLADEIFPVQDLDLNYEELYENLAQLLTNPIDLNQASAEELRSLLVLSETEVEAFIHYRQEQGNLLSIYELQAIPGLDIDIINRLIPFTIVNDPSTSLDQNLLKRIVKEKNNYLIIRNERTLEDKKGYQSGTDSSSRYAGSPDKLYSRFRISHTGDFSFGFTVEKDAGESFSWNPKSKKYGFDYHSVHAQVINKGRVKNLILGDFQAQFGQGLLLGGGFGMGKGSESITTIRRSNLGFIPYTSLNEFGFFRGAAITATLLKNLSLSGFLSQLNRDGRITQSAIMEDQNSISSLGTSGFHRTATEFESRKKINENNYGLILNYKRRSLDGGLLFHQTYFGVPIYHDPTPYNQFTFRDNQNSNLGIFLNYTWRNFTFFSEAAKTLHHGTGITMGSLGSLTSKLDISLLYRNFTKDFYTFYSNAVSENTLPQNESGFYWGLKYNFDKKYSLSGYVDLFRFPWLRYRGYSSSAGREWLMRFNYRPTKMVSMFVQAREESKIRNTPTETNLHQTGIGSKKNFWFNVDYIATKNLSFKTRVQFSTYSLSNSLTKGLALVQDLNFDVGRFIFSTRYAIFDTDDYDNRQYVYERDVWLAFSFPAYYGVGIRSYAMVQYKVSQKIDLWLRWARTNYTDRDSIGSGGETIYGNTKNDLKFQARITL